MKKPKTIAAFLLAAGVSAQIPVRNPPPSFELARHRMDVDVDGSPNAYGPPGKPTLDYPSNAHTMGNLRAPIVGYMTERDHRTPVVQGPNDPFPGYYVSQTTFEDDANPNERDPRRYVDATKISYIVLGNKAKHLGARVGDFVAAYSTQTHRSAFGIVGDTGNPSGDEGSLHLLQDLGYPFHDGKDDAVEEDGEIIVRYYPHSNPSRQFFFTQAALDEAAIKLGLSKDFARSPLAQPKHPSRKSD